MAPRTCSAGCFRGGEVVHKHLRPGFRVSTGPGWESAPRPEGGLISHLRDPESGINVVMWAASTCGC